MALKNRIVMHQWELLYASRWLCHEAQTLYEPTRQGRPGLVIVETLALMLPGEVGVPRLLIDQESIFLAKAS